ncbi:HesA/MoeB/ThiF family protein [Nocardia sp. CDC160]|uniref:HesA/MoeB/ThiF family protein n=1 Tax=Nocardia sp. CDC160 TaxID=3112166 RepID=UPI002DB64F05|nr:ThiF family adenylyltransferase [Nocardia sp. CDC160]MEC3920365.1 ThiF family adenylyltransferase [Nocardia sp. CDC160]
MTSRIRVLDMARPRVKPELTPYATVDGTVRIGATVYGLGMEIDDPDGRIETLVVTLDGTRSPDEIVSAVSTHHEKASAREIVDTMQQLLDAGLLEDYGAPVPAELTDRERDRYSRSIPFLRWIDRLPRASSWDVQIKLRRSRVLLIGLGGVGGAVAQGLVASGVGSLHCIDADFVELSNLNRQVLYREADIGRTKVDAATEHLRDLNSDVEISGEQRWIVSEADLSALLEPSYDLVALCADNPRVIRRWANRAFYPAGITWVVGGYHGPMASASVHGPESGACWECLHDQAVDAPDMRMPPGMSIDDLNPRFPWEPVNIVSATITGAFLTHFALAVLTGAPPIEPGFSYEVNLAIPGESTLIRHARRADCPTCGDSR